MLTICHLELSEANAFVLEKHRHHKPCTGHRFSIGCSDAGILVGVSIVGRPVSRGCNFRTTVEVSRLCTDGTKNACSFLYSACARAARELGYAKIQTYILEDEPGTSLLAAGWVFEDKTSGGHWSGSNKKPRRSDQPEGPKLRFAKILR